MLNAARKRGAYVEGLTFEGFARDEKTFDAVIRQLTILGEAATHVPEEIVSRTSDIPWFEIRGMRNIVVHDYFGVNSRIVWETATKNIPELLPLLERLLADVSQGNQDEGLP
ncbi:MAG: DUF86 domain-containing protein [Desulfosoma sp.]